MSNLTADQAAALSALREAAMDRQLYVLKGITAIGPRKDHELITRVLHLSDALIMTGYPLDLDALLSEVEAEALEQTLLG